MSILDELAAQKQEHEAWLDVVKEWREILPPAYDMTTPLVTPLVKAIELWGERLVALREFHEPEKCEKALKDRIAAYQATK